MGESPFSVMTGGVVSPELACGVSGSDPPELPPHALVNSTTATSNDLKRGHVLPDGWFIVTAWRIAVAISTYLREGGFVA
jgi:hypothetical protein